ncbi:MAG: hypothetical protein ACRDJE_20215 [Dehalococcoidia bacterium]
MTENTPEQQQLQAATERVGEKLQRFYEALPVDEQIVFSLALHQNSAQTSEPAEDVTGYFFGGLLPLISVKVPELVKQQPTTTQQPPQTPQRS